LDAAWQLVGRGDGASDTTPWGGLAVLTDERLLMCEYALSNFRERKGNVPLCALKIRAEVKNHSRSTPIFSFLWVGPALLFSHKDGVSVLGWDGKVSTAFVRGVGGGNELALSAATEDALLLFLDANGTDAESARRIPNARRLFSAPSRSRTRCSSGGARSFTPSHAMDRTASRTVYYWSREGRWRRRCRGTTRRASRFAPSLTWRTRFRYQVSPPTSRAERRT
jgi:hypothetical protein